MRSRSAFARSAWRSGRSASGRRGIATSSAACAGSSSRGTAPNHASEPARTPSRLPPIRRQRQPDARGFRCLQKCASNWMRAGNFQKLAAQRPRARLQQPGGLHRQRRPARDDAAGAQVWTARRASASGLTPGMVPEPAILGGDQDVQQRGATVVGGGAEPPDAAGAGSSATVRPSRSTTSVPVLASRDRSGGNSRSSATAAPANSSRAPRVNAPQRQRRHAPASNRPGTAAGIANQRGTGWAIIRAATPGCG